MNGCKIQADLTRSAKWVDKQYGSNAFGRRTGYAVVIYAKCYPAVTLHNHEMENGHLPNKLIVAPKCARKIATTNHYPND
jgi:hypothetical protein